MQKSFDLRGIPMSELNHAEALELAHLKKVDSNLARCYIDLATRRPPAIDGEPRPVDSMERVLRQIVAYADDLATPIGDEKPPRLSADDAKWFVSLCRAALSDSPQEDT